MKWAPVLLVVAFVVYAVALSSFFHKDES